MKITEAIQILKEAKKDKDGNVIVGVKEHIKNLYDVKAENKDLNNLDTELKQAKTDINTLFNNKQNNLTSDNAGNNISIDTNPNTGKVRINLNGNIPNSGVTPEQLEQAKTDLKTYTNDKAQDAVDNFVENTYNDKIDEINDSIDNLNNNITTLTNKQRTLASRIETLESVSVDYQVVQDVGFDNIITIELSGRETNLGTLDLQQPFWFRLSVEPHALNFSPPQLYIPGGGSMKSMQFNSNYDVLYVYNDNGDPIISPQGIKITKYAYTNILNPNSLSNLTIVDEGKVYLSYITQPGTPIQ